MLRASALLALVVVNGACRDDGSCGFEGLVVTIEAADGSFEPGVYQLDITLDDLAATVVCEAGADGLIDFCAAEGDPETGLTSPVHGLQAADEGFSSMFFAVTYPDAVCVPRDAMPARASVTVRRDDTVLATDAWTPEYHACRDDFCGKTWSSHHEIVLGGS